jgi:hypothetical protein
MTATGNPLSKEDISAQKSGYMTVADTFVL